MNKTKLVLAFVGLAAIVVPAILLITLSGRPAEMPQLPSETRKINTKNVEDAAARARPSPAPIVVSPSPRPTESSLSAAPTSTPTPSPIDF